VEGSVDGDAEEVADTTDVSTGLLNLIEDAVGTERLSGDPGLLPWEVAAGQGDSRTILGVPPSLRSRQWLLSLAGENGKQARTQRAGGSVAYLAVGRRHPWRRRSF
jgi:hypothetical protein